MNHNEPQANLVRFPAGSGSDAYFFNVKQASYRRRTCQLMDKDGIKKDPGYGYGKTTDNWRASLDNYYDMLLQSNNKGFLL